MDIETQLRQFVRDNLMFGDTRHELKKDQSFLNSGIIDSTGVLELVAFLEDNFQIKVNDEEIVPENLDSIERLIQFVTRKQAGVETNSAELAHAFGI
ncbi:MAG: acyl carrier protein [candidate division KSB1 bacterium]|nr:acyl carrier protein [candidate division KSB1 bacterium]